MARTMTAELLEEKLQINPASLAFARLADFRRNAGNLDEAVDLCRKGIERYPEYVTGHLVMGRCLREQKKLDDAASSLTMACRLDRRNSAAIKMLADIFIEQGSPDKAGDLYALLARFDPYDVFLSSLAEKTRGTGDKDLFSILNRIPAAPVPAAQPGPAEEEISLPEKAGASGAGGERGRG